MSADRDLQRAFAELRDVERKLLPEFGGLAAGPPRAGGRGRVRWVLISGAAAALAAVVLFRPAGERPALDQALAMATALSSWTAPTDDLLGLELPGSVLRGDIADLDLEALALPQVDAVEVVE
jgi:hypothetical protein